jgi:hypothetical protein
VRQIPFPVLNHTSLPTIEKGVGVFSISKDAINTMRILRITIPLGIVKISLFHDLGQFVFHLFLKILLEIHEMKVEFSLISDYSRKFQSPVCAFESLMVLMARESHFLDRLHTKAGSVRSICVSQKIPLTDLGIPKRHPLKGTTHVPLQSR